MLHYFYNCLRDTKTTSNLDAFFSDRQVENLNRHMQSGCDCRLYIIRACRRIPRDGVVPSFEQCYQTMRSITAHGGQHDAHYGRESALM